MRDIAHDCAPLRAENVRQLGCSIRAEKQEVRGWQELRPFFRIRPKEPPMPTRDQLAAIALRYDTTMARAMLRALGLA